MKFRSRWMLAIALISSSASVTFVACSSDLADIENGDGIGVGGCTDEDNDGFGVGCASGQDCDDKNPAVTNECFACGATPRTGCGCSTEGARAECGKLVSKTTSGLVCGRGLMVCSGGTWGACVLNNAPFDVKPMALASNASPCADPCDPYCQTWNDTPDPSVADGGGVVATDAGISLEGTGVTWADSGDAMNPAVAAILQDSGTMPDGSFYYHELLPGQNAPVEDDLLINASIKFIDVYFLLDTSATMGPALSQLGAATAGPGGIIPTVKATFPNARFGVGHFHAYQTPPHDRTVGPYQTIPWIGGGTKAVFPLWHSLNMQGNDVAAQNVMLWLGGNGTTSNNDSTEGANVALFAAATPFGLWAENSLGTGFGVGYDGLNNKRHWVNPRNAGAPYTWVTDYPGIAGGQPALPAGTSLSGPCPNGTDVGYPCFDQQATPIFVLMTDNPGEQGPGGLFAQGHQVPAAETMLATSTAPTPGASEWTAATVVAGNTTEATAVIVDPTRFQRFRGDLNGNPAAQRLIGADCGGTQAACFDLTVNAGKFPTVVPGDTGLGTVGCASAAAPGQTGIGAGREAYFRFTVPAGLPGGGMWLHFDTFGSSRDLVMYVIDTATRGRVACGDNYYNGTMTAGAPTQQPHIDARLGAGSYILVVDEKAVTAGASTYFLQVNAMPDGWVGAPPAPPAAPYPTNGSPQWVTIPSFEQTIAAVNQMGGKFIGIDASGIGRVNPGGTSFDVCDPNASNASPTSRIDRWTFTTLQEAARRTGSVDGTNPNYWTNPFVFPVAGDGTRCRAADPSLATLTANAITQLAATVRQDVTVFALDADDLTDFDGPPGGAPNLTPANVNEGPQAGLPHGVFIANVTALPFTNGINGSNDTFGGQPRCNGGVGNYLDPITGMTLTTNSVMRGCIPNTQVLFKVRFGVPAAMVQRPVPQIFKFDVTVQEVSGASVLGATPAVVVIPPVISSYPPTGTWERTYDASSVCPVGTRPVWNLWSWNASVPAGTNINFFVSTASTAAGLAAAPEDPLQFTNPPGPLGLVGTPVGVVPATASGSALVDTTLALNGRPRGEPFLKVKSVLTSGGGGTLTPTLQSWNLSVSCPPYE